MTQQILGTLVALYDLIVEPKAQKSANVAGWLGKQVSLFQISGKIMVSLYGILNIGARGITAAQAGLDTTGHNISNANTEGYSRQRVVQRNVDPIITPQAAFGMGVDIATIERLRDNFLETQIRTAQSNSSYNQEMDRIFTRLESIIKDPLDSISESNDPSTAGGLNNALTQFFRNMHQLSISPESPEIRIAALESAQTLSDTFNYTNSELFNLMDEMNDQVAHYVNKINNLANELVTLNSKISTLEGSDTIEANDYRDQRDRILKQISDIVPITTKEDETGILNVSIAGQWLVDHLNTNPLQLEVIEQIEDIDITTIRMDKTGLTTLESEIKQGKLGAVLDARDRLIPDLMKQIDELAHGMIQEVNNIHSGASGLEGYNEVQSNFVFADHLTEPDALKTLNDIFNSPAKTDELKKEFSIQDGQLNIRVTDQDGNEKDTYSIDIETNDTVFDLVEKINRSDGIVSEARSALTFDPVYVEQTSSQVTFDAADLTTAIGSLGIAAATPIAETPGAYTFEIHLKNKAGSLVDNDLSTSVYDPITVTINDTDTLADVATAIQSASNGKLRANVLPSEDDPTQSVLRITTVEDGESFSIQNDTSGLIQALDFPMTDPTIPLMGGMSTEESFSFTGLPTDSYLGTGPGPNFSPAFPGPPPSVLSEGSFEFVVMGNNNVPTVNTINIDAAGIDTMAELETALEATDPNIDVTITPDNQFTITASNGRQFFFQNDDTGLVEAMGFEDISGYGSLFGQPFTDGSFEIVVANDNGTVSHIVDVPVKADPSTVGGTLTLQGIIDSINSAASQSGAPIRARIIEDPTDPSRNQIVVESTNHSEFTFRSDDSLLLSALGFTEGPVLNATNQTPIAGAESTLALGDNIGGIIRAQLGENNQLTLSTAGNDEFSFAGDSSNILTAIGMNGLFTGNDARSMQVNQNLVENINLLATSKDGSPGNNEAALEMANLENDRVFNGKKPGEFYRTTVSKLGAEGQKVKQGMKTNDTILKELNAVQDQNAGVSLDEESINLIKFQQAFQASARMISTVDRLLDLVINSMGR